jgi:hypothetical protein
LQAYSRSVDPLYYTTKIIDGLRDDIKTTVVMQHPSNLDIACCLALLLEESSVTTSRKFRRFDSGYTRPQHKGPFPLPRPTEQNKQSSTTDTQDKGTLKTQFAEDKMASLIAYRMAKGLCKKCGEKWSKAHQCANAVQLHVLQEVWDLFGYEDFDTQDYSVSVQLLMVVSVAAVSGKEAPKTLKIKGSI